ncbi:PREDICTED: uncharacterized protein LOC109591373, partial [Amphimedon queenslandica]|uniref:Uncharacterized protein n=1 Tax=Amphimedon queenslandica TaxID=400682 RepID=A0AAN0JZY1_AMPQE
VSELCFGEHPNNATVNILNINNEIQDSARISNNDTFSHQRVPRSVREGGSDIVTFNETNATASFNIPITLECTGEAPGNVTVIIQCTGTGVVYTDTILVEYAKQPMNITGSVPVPLYQQCNISIVFSNEAGSSEPFILAFDTTPLPISNTPSPTNTPLVTSTPGTTSPSTVIIIPVVISLTIVIIIIIIIIIMMIIAVYKRNRNRATPVNTLPNAAYEAYGEVGGTTTTEQQQQVTYEEVN